MAQRYSSTENIPSEVVTLAPDPQFVPENLLGLAGDALLKLSSDLQDAKDAETVAKSTANYNAEMTAAELELANLDPRDDNVDFAEHMKMAGQRAMANAYKIKSKRARERVINNITLNNQRYEAQAAYSSIKKTGSLIRLEMSDKMQMFADERNRAGFEEYLSGVSGFVTTGEREHALAAYDRLEKKLIDDEIEDQALLLTMSIAEDEGIDAATDALKQMRDDGTLTVDNYKAVRTELVREHNFNTAQENEAQSKAYNESVEKTFDEKIVTNDYTNLEEFVDALPGFTGAQRISLLTTLENRAVALNGGNKDPYLQSDGAKVFEFTQRLEADPTSVSAEELFNAVGKGLDNGITIEQWKDFTALRKAGPNAEHNKTVAKEGIGMIDNMLQSSLSIYRAGLDTKNGEVEDFDLIWKYRDAATQMKSEYRRWMQEAEDKGVTLTDQDHRTKINSLVRPEEDEIVLNAIQKFTGFGTITKSGEAQAVALRSIERLEQMGLWDRLGDNEKTRARKALLAGTPIEDIVKGIYEVNTNIGIKYIEQSVAELNTLGVWSTLTNGQQDKIKRAFAQGKTVEQVIEALKDEK